MICEGNVSKEIRKHFSNFLAAENSHSKVWLSDLFRFTWLTILLSLSCPAHTVFDQQSLQIFRNMELKGRNHRL